MKFGGTSMGSAERMRVAAGLIGRERTKRPVCVVVSAMSKITDLLLDTMRHAELGDRATVEKNLATLLDRHTQACEELFAESIDAVRFREAAANAVQSLAAEFHRIAGGILMLGTRPPRSVDEAVAIGERLSSVLLAQLSGGKRHSGAGGKCGRHHRDGRGVWECFAADGADQAEMPGEGGAAA